MHNKEFCVGMMTNSTINIDGGPHLLICLYGNSTVQDALSRVAYPVCLMVSNVFLLLTFVIYGCLPELRQPLFGKITMIFLLSLTFAYLMAAIVKFVE